MFGTGNSEAFGGTQQVSIESNEESAIMGDYNVKEVEKAPKVEKVNYDLTGPENEGIIATAVPSENIQDTQSGSVIGANVTVMLTPTHVDGGIKNLETISAAHAVVFAEKVLAYVQKPNKRYVELSEYEDENSKKDRVGATMNLDNPFIKYLSTKVKGCSLTDSKGKTLTSKNLQNLVSFKPDTKEIKNYENVAKVLYNYGLTKKKLIVDGKDYRFEPLFLDYSSYGKYYNANRKKLDKLATALQEASSAEFGGRNSNPVVSIDNFLKACGDNGGSNFNELFGWYKKATASDRLSAVKSILNSMFTATDKVKAVKEFGNLWEEQVLVCKASAGTKKGSTKEYEVTYDLAEQLAVELMKDGYSTVIAREKDSKLLANGDVYSPASIDAYARESGAAVNIVVDACADSTIYIPLDSGDNDTISIIANKTKEEWPDITKSPEIKKTFAFGVLNHASIPTMRVSYYKLKDENIFNKIKKGIGSYAKAIVAGLNAAGLQPNAGASLTASTPGDNSLTTQSGTGNFKGTTVSGGSNPKSSSSSSSSSSPSKSSGKGGRVKLKAANGTAYPFKPVGSKGKLYKPSSGWNGKTVAVNAGHQRAQCLDSNGKVMEVPQGPKSSTKKIQDTTSGGCSLTYNGVTKSEYEITYDIANLVKSQLLKKGYTVYMVRDTKGGNYSCSNRDRSLYANLNADAQVAIHVDDTDSSSANGMSLLVPDSSIVYKSVPYAKSQKLGESLKGAWSKSKTGIKYKGTSIRNDLVGICWSSIPIVYLETGFASNKNDAKCITNNKKKIAGCIANGIDKYFK